jgi:hypothetical protein
MRDQTALRVRLRLHVDGSWDERINAAEETSRNQLNKIVMSTLVFRIASLLESSQRKIANSGQLDLMGFCSSLGSAACCAKRKLCKSTKGEAQQTPRLR